MKLKELPRNVLAASLTSFLMDISSEMVLNLVPLFLANVLGAGGTVIGAVEGVAESVASLLRVVSGYISDRLRRRKWLGLHGKKLGSFLDVVVAKPVLQSIPRRDFSPYFKAGFVPRKRPKIKTLPLKTPTEVRRIDAQSIRADHRGQGAENCLPKGFPLGDDLAISLHNKILAPKTSFVERI